MSLGRIVIGIVLFTAVFVGIMTVFADLDSTYAPNISSEFRNATSQFGRSDFDTLNNQSRDLVHRGFGLDNASSSPTDTPEDSFWKNSYATMKLIPNSFGIMYKITTAIGQYVGIDPLWVSTLLVVIVLIIVFRVISAVLKNSIL